MPSALGPFLAALRTGRKRRAAVWLLILAILLLGLLSFGTFMDFRQQRQYFNQALAQGLFGGINCGDFEGEPPAAVPVESQPPEGKPTDGQSTPGRPVGPQNCYFVGPSGEQVGPTLSPEEAQTFFQTLKGPPQPGVDPEAAQRALFEKYRPILEPEFRKQLTVLEGAYSPRRLFVARTRMAGTFWGILFIIIFGATLLGADWRWSVWRTQLTHEPRRGRVLAGKIGALWVLVATGFLIALAVLGGLDQLFRTIFSVTAHGGPGYRSIAVDVARSLLPLEVYATIAAASALVARTSLVGLGFPLATLLADGLLTNRFSVLRPFSATQQIAWLVTRPETYTAPYAPMAWWPKIVSKSVCTLARGVQQSGEFVTCRDVKLPPIPEWRAMVVLGVWISVFVFAAYAMLRARDVPQ